VVEAPPFLITRVVGGWEDGDVLKAFTRFDRFERRDNPLDTQPFPLQLQIFEFCGLGEVKARCPRRFYTREQW